jgi:hypothetical protein
MILLMRIEILIPIVAKSYHTISQRLLMNGMTLVGHGIPFIRRSLSTRERSAPESS